MCSKYVCTRSVPYSLYDGLFGCYLSFVETFRDIYHNFTFYQLLSDQFFVTNSDEDLIRGSVYFQVVDELLTKLDGMSTHETVQSSVQQIKAKVNGAIEASNELAGTIGIKALDENFHKATEELKTISPRHGWLENRIKSHNEALEHWEKNPVTEENTPEADA